MYKLNLTKGELRVVYLAVKADLAIVEDNLDSFEDDYSPLLRVVTKLERILHDM